MTQSGEYRKSLTSHDVTSRTILVARCFRCGASRVDTNAPMLWPMIASSAALSSSRRLAFLTTHRRHVAHGWHHPFYTVGVYKMKLSIWSLTSPDSQYTVGQKSCTFLNTPTVEVFPPFSKLFLTFYSILCSTYDVCSCSVIAVIVLYCTFMWHVRPFAVYFNKFSST